MGHLANLVAQTTNYLTVEEQTAFAREVETLLARSSTTEERLSILEGLLDPDAKFHASTPLTDAQGPMTDGQDSFSSEAWS